MKNGSVTSTSSVPRNGVSVRARIQARSTAIISEGTVLASEIPTVLSSISRLRRVKHVAIAVEIERAGGARRRRMQAAIEQHRQRDRPSGRRAAATSSDQDGRPACRPRLQQAQRRRQTCRRRRPANTSCRSSAETVIPEPRGRAFFASAIISGRSASFAGPISLAFANGFASASAFRQRRLHHRRHPAIGVRSAANSESRKCWMKSRAAFGCGAFFSTAMIHLGVGRALLGYHDLDRQALQVGGKREDLGT